MKQLFVSQPYGDRSKEDILEERAQIVAWVEQILGVKFEPMRQYERITPEGAPRFYHLSQDLLLMGEADLIAFAPDWKSAGGCQIEHALATQYKLPMIDFGDARRR